MFIMYKTFDNCMENMGKAFECGRELLSERLQTIVDGQEVYKTAAGFIMAISQGSIKKLNEEASEGKLEQSMLDTYTKAIEEERDMLIEDLETFYNQF